MKITVTTPTGHIGSKLANILIDRGAEVTVIVRDPHKVEKLAARGAHVVAGEHSDPAVVKRAISGAGSMFWLIPGNYTTHDPLGDSRTFAEAAATAVQGAPDLKLVLLSSVGAHRSEGTGPILGLHHAEQQLTRAAKNFTALRPNYFMENVLSSLPTIVKDGNIYSVCPGNVSAPQIATDDIAAIAADVLLAGQTGHHIVDLVGSEDITFDQVAETLTNVLGKKISHVKVPDEALTAGFTGAGLSIELARLLVEMQHSFTTGLPHELLGESKFGGKKKFETFAREVVLPAYQQMKQAAA